MGLKSYTYGSYTRYLIPHLKNVLFAKGTREYWELEHKFALEKLNHHETCGDNCVNVIKEKFRNNSFVAVAVSPYFIYRLCKILKWYERCAECSSNY